LGGGVGFGPHLFVKEPRPRDSEVTSLLYGFKSSFEGAQAPGLLLATPMVMHHKWNGC